MRAIVAGLALALLIVVPVSAAPPVGYTIALSSADPVSFAITGPAQDASSPVAWVHLECGDFEADAPVLWGHVGSTSGTASFYDVPPGSCTAWVTETPWRVRKTDPSVTFTP